MKRLLHVLFGHRYLYILRERNGVNVLVYQCSCGAQAWDEGVT